MKFRVLLRCIAPLLVVGFVAVSFQEAAARAGRSRSFGSRGTSSYSASARPSPSYGSSRSQQVPPTSPAQPFGPGQPGSFLRGLGGGLVGGLLGGMLFRSLGFAGPGAGGGMGLFDLALLAGGGYLLYRFVAARRRNEPGRATASFFGPGSRETEPTSSRYASAELPGWEPASAAPSDGALTGLSLIRQADPAFGEARFRDTAQDIFFRVQGAWTRRDLAPVAELLDDDVRRTLQADLDELKHCGEINRLENISVREAEIVEAWQDQGQDVLTFRLLASLLDYTTDELGNVKSGSDHEPVKFEEYWTFARPTGPGPWRLTAIQQP